MKMQVLDIQNGKQSSLDVADGFFAREYNAPLVHQVVNAHLSNARSGSKGFKNRSNVRGGGSKPWRQKGSGRARSGTASSPIWRGGGVTFAPKTNHRQKINKKMYQAALGVIFSQLNRQGQLKVIKDFSFKTPKTKETLVFLKKVDVDDVLIIGADFDENIYLSTRNLYHVGVCDVADMDPISLIGYRNIVITESALKQINGAI